jgi:hypothetical protein
LNGWNFYFFPLSSSQKKKTLLRKIFLFCHHSAKICSHKQKKLILTHKHENLHNLKHKRPFKL